MTEGRDISPRANPPPSRGSAAGVIGSLPAAASSAAPPPCPPPRGGSVAAAPGRFQLLRHLAFALAVAPAALFALGAGLAGLDAAFPPRLEPAAAPSPIVLDRGDRLLAAFTTDAGRWRLPVTGAAVDPRFLEMLVAYEDQRFATHAGVDPLALGRAALQAVEHGRIVSGASTLTMQVARLLDERSERTLARKLAESVRALQIERRLTKAEILDRYLAVAPYGGNLEGVRAASLAYFGREPDRLTIGQAALLVALPQAPQSRRPDRFPDAARAGRDAVLDRMARLGVLTPAEVESGKAEPVPTARRDFPRLAAHAAAAARAARPAATVHRLTLDRDLQAALETLVAERARALGPRVSGAAVVVDTKSGEILARVGSAGLLDEAREGYVDMTAAVRSPGSTLKPFVYGLAFEAGLAHPETLVEDRPTSFGGYAPKNFDDGYKGTVTTREALQMSLNVPAVALLEAVGPTRLTLRLEDVGVRLALPAAAEPSLAIGLGGAGVRLVDLAALYAGLGRGGVVPALTEIRDGPPDEAGATANASASAAPAGRRLLDPVAAWYVADVLAGAPPPVNAPAGRIAFKTGTSYGYRDAWAAGFDGRHAVAVWMGRPDGAPVAGLVGRDAAAPVLFDAFARISPRRAPLPRAPDGALIATTATLPPPLRGFGKAAETPATQASARRGVRFAFPPDGARVSLAAPGGGRQPLAWRVEGTTRPLTLFVDGRPAGAPRAVRGGDVPVSGRGFLRLTVVDAGGASDSVTVFVE